MGEVVFALIGLVAIAGGVSMVLARNPVHSALFLVVNLFCVAFLYMSLNAEFLSVVQVIVYAGAIMVLFLFVVMLLNVKGETPLLTPGAAKGFGFLFGLIVATELLWIVLSPGGSEGGPSPVATLPAGFGSPAGLGMLLYTTWLYPFEIVSLLLLVAVVGAVVLAKRKFF